MERNNIIIDLLSFKQSEEEVVLPTTSVDRAQKQQIHKEHDIDHDLPNKKEVKKSPYQPTSLDQPFKTTRDSHR
ncbi:hypothetical protein H5410_060826 [Solanum commersonii]|uniref:Uncharacterized protein n=1 Tax=Solanum commersonii TaxID=4109 RepID=A0A9J5W764_SOLCO|nr:hypothetical protein H5410_060826 [Solanum commersonii]